MILFVSLRVSHIPQYETILREDKIHSKLVKNAVIDLLYPLSQINIEILKSISKIVIINETELPYNDGAFKNIGIGEFLIGKKKFEHFYSKVNYGDLYIIKRLLDNPVILSEMDDMEKIRFYVGEPITAYFISNIAGEITYTILKKLDITELCPIQQSSGKKHYNVIKNPGEFISIFDHVFSLRKDNDPNLDYYEEVISVLEIIGKKTILELNTIDSGNNIVIQGGDPLLIEVALKFLLRKQIRKQYIDFQFEVPKIEPDIDVLILVNFHKLTINEKSVIWLKTDSLRKKNKKIIVISNDEESKMEVLPMFKRLFLPQFNSISQKLLKILIFLVNSKTSKKKIWLTPSNHKTIQLNSYLDDISDLKLLESIVNSLDLNMYDEKIFSPDFWFDFVEAKNKLRNHQLQEPTLFGFDYLNPLSNSEIKAIENYGIVYDKIYQITKLMNLSYKICLPDRTFIEIKKCKGMEYIYHIIENKYCSPEAIDIETLYENINGKKYRLSKKKSIDTLANTIRATTSYLFAKHSSFIGEWKEYIFIEKNGCYYKESTSFYIKIVKDIEDV